MTPFTPQESERLAALGQDHVAAFAARLDASAANALAEQVRALDLDLVRELRQLLFEPPADALERSFEPPELFPLRRDGAEEARANEARERGDELFAAGKVGFVLVAGGQASRLGLDAPKGTFGVGPVTKRSLFEIHARRLLAARARYGCATPWYVMTSPANDGPTKAFFERHDFFGMPREDVVFFQQDMLPALDEEGRMLFAAPDRLFLAPNGHGGSLLGLASSGALRDARDRGLEQLSYFQVDNPLVRPADPLFLGLHAAAGAGMSTKVVEKRGPGEKVGVIGRIDGRMGCIEYSDLPEELREARDDGGSLRFRAGNIAVHVLDLAFVESLTNGELHLPWHLAKKTMKVCDADGAQAERPGTKFETFVFDALAASEQSVTLEVAREEEFSPVKNAAGEDSPATAHADQCRLFAGWVQAAGGTLPAPDAEGLAVVEVDPLLAESATDFAAKGPPAPEVRPAGHFYG